MTLLFLTPRYPWPLIGGDRIKAYYLLQHLATKHRVILVTFSHGTDATAEQLSAIRSLGVEVHNVKLSPLWAAIGSLRTVWTNQPIEIAFYNRPTFARAVDSVLSNTQVDIAIAFFARTAEYISKHRGLGKLLIAEDCRVEYQTRSMLASTSWLQRVVRWWEIFKLRTHEPDVVRHFDAVTYVSREDLAAMQAMMPSIHYAVVTNGVDLDRFSYRGDQAQRSGVLFIGKLDVHANVLMVDAIVETIMPRVRAVLPNVQLTIVGGDPPRKLQLLKDKVNLAGAVPDGVPYLHDAAVFLHPHAGASGIQNKLLEAMAAGCAVVTTITGIQGIDAIHNVHCLIASTHAEAAEFVIRLLNNPLERAILAANARKLMEDTHSWALVNRQLDTVIDGIGRREPHDASI